MDRIWLSTGPQPEPSTMDASQPPPSWRADLPILRRDTRSVLVADDPRPVDLSIPEEDWLLNIGFFPTWEQAWAACPGGRARAEAIIDKVGSSGALQEPHECWWLSPQQRLQAQPHLLALSAWHADPQQAIAARASTFVRVVGEDSVAAQLRPMIRLVGLLEADGSGVGSANIVIVAGINGIDAPGALFDVQQELLESPHLPVSVHRAKASIGPLVIPGRSPCLRCVHLHSRDVDPAWPLVAEQWARARASWSLGADPLLAMLAAVSAASMVRRWVDNPESMDSYQVRWQLPEAEPTIRRISAHPTCGCLWSSTCPAT